MLACPPWHSAGPGIEGVGVFLRDVPDLPRSKPAVLPGQSGCPCGQLPLRLPWLPRIMFPEIFANCPGSEGRQHERADFSTPGECPLSVGRDRPVGVPGLSLRSQELESSPEFPPCSSAPVQRECSLGRNPSDTATLPFRKLHQLIYFAWCVS